MEVVRIQDLTREERVLLLKELGYDADSTGKGVSENKLVKS